MIVDVETHFGCGSEIEGKAIKTRSNDLVFEAMIMRRDHGTLNEILTIKVIKMVMYHGF